MSDVSDSVELVHLHVAGAGTLQTLDNGRQPFAVGVVSVDLALIVHRRRHGQCLAAAAGAVIEDLLGLARQGEVCDNLRALVLHLEPTLLERDFRRYVRQARCALAGGNAHTVPGNRRRLSAAALQRLQHLFARRLQRVDAQIESRPAGKSLRLGEPVVGEILFERALRPFRNIALHMQGSIFEPSLGEGLHHRFRRRFGREPVVGEFRRKRVGAKAPLPVHDRMAEGYRGVAVHEVGVGEFHPQGIIDDVADGGAIAGAGEAVGQAPILEGIGDGSPALFDIVKNLDGPGEPSAQSHLR